MRISIRASTRPVRGSDVHPLRWAFEEGSRLGFDGLELCMGANRNSFVTFWTGEMKDAVKDLCAEFDMSIFSLSSDWAWAYACFFPAFKDWGKGMEFMAEDARLARQLGAHSILMHFATAKGSWEDCRAALKDVAAAGEENGIVFGYEANIWERVGFGGLDALCRMTDQIGSPYFGVYLHNAYPRGGLPLHEEVEMAGERLLQAMHSASLVSGRVQIDFQKAFATMKNRFADGAYTFEVPWDIAEANKKLIDEMIARYW